MCTFVNFVRFSISYFCGMNGSIKQYEWFKRLNDRQVNELIGLIDDWPIIDTEPIDSNVWLDRERWTNIDLVMIFVSGTVCTHLISSHLSPLTSEVVGAPQRSLQQYMSTLSCLPLLLGNLQTPFLSIPWCYLPILSSVFLSFLLISLSPAELFSPCQRILRCGHTIWVSVSLPWSGDHHALQLHSGFCIHAI